MDTTKSIKVVLFLPEQMIDSVDSEIKDLLHNLGDVKIFSFGIDRLPQMDINESGSFFDVFFFRCQQAQIVFLNNWLPQIKQAVVSKESTKTEDYPEDKEPKMQIQSPEKSTFRGQAEMGSLAEHLSIIAPQTKLYSLAAGGAYQAPVHKYAKMIYSFRDSQIIKDAETLLAG